MSLICFYQSTFAKDFGTNGHTYKIVEQHFLKMIDERVKKVDWGEEKSKMEKIAKTRLNIPTPLDDITPAKETRVFYFDPTYELDEDAVLPSGEILHKTGTKVNPLEHIEFDRRMIFLDSRKKSK
ncbi:MAG UNVERIFIED_CONTAM: hypothetical protein LVQ98_08505 [Rickettsiaceae bacterium]